MHPLTATLKSLTPGRIYALGNADNIQHAVAMAQDMDPQVLRWAADGDALILKCWSSQQTIRPGNRPDKLFGDCTCGDSKPGRPCVHVLAGVIMLNGLLRQGKINGRAPTDPDAAAKALGLLLDSPPGEPASDGPKPGPAQPPPARRKPRLTVIPDPNGGFSVHAPFSSVFSPGFPLDLMVAAQKQLRSPELEDLVGAIEALQPHFDVRIGLATGDIPFPSTEVMGHGTTGVTLEWQDEEVWFYPTLQYTLPAGCDPQPDPAAAGEATKPTDGQGSSPKAVESVIRLAPALAVVGHKWLVELDDSVVWNLDAYGYETGWQEPLLALDASALDDWLPPEPDEDVLTQLQPVNMPAQVWRRAGMGMPVVPTDDKGLEGRGISLLIDGRRVAPIPMATVPCLHLASPGRQPGDAAVANDPGVPFDPASGQLPDTVFARLSLEVGGEPVFGLQGLSQVLNLGLMFSRLSSAPNPELYPQNDPILVADEDFEAADDEDEDDEDDDDDPFLMDHDWEDDEDEWHNPKSHPPLNALLVDLDPDYPHPIPAWRVASAAGRIPLPKPPKELTGQFLELWWAYLDAAAAGAEIDLERMKVDLPQLALALTLRLVRNGGRPTILPPRLLPVDPEGAGRCWAQVDDPLDAAARALRVGTVLHRQLRSIWSPKLKLDEPWPVKGNLLAQRFHELLDLAALHQVTLTWEGRPIELVDINVRLEARPSDGDPDWFELRPEVGTSQFRLNDDEWVRLLAGQLVRDGRLLMAHGESRDRLLALDRVLGSRDRRPGVGEDDDQASRAPRLQMFDWLELRRRGIEVDIPDDVTRLINRLTKPDEIEPLPLPTGLRAEMRPYQQRGYQWLAFLYTHRFGACLADDMGLGKTLQAIALLGGLHEGTVPLQQSGRGHQRRPHLIVLPPTLVFNWQNELERFYPDLEVVEYRGGRGKPEFPPGSVVLTTYDQVRLRIDQLAEVPFECLVFDEAQAAKNWTSQRAKAARRLQARFRLCLTGTPLENHAGEYHSIMELALPGLFGDRRRFVRAIKDDGDEATMLLNRARPFVMRRTKNLILTELPPKVETEITLPCNDVQREMYTRTVAEVRDDIAEAYQLKNQAMAGIKALAALMRLRQICISPALLDPAVREPSPKLLMLAEKLRELLDEDQSALVFSQFTGALDQVEVVLGGNDIPYQRLDGSTPKPQRRKLVEAFQDGSGPGVFLISLKTGGAGLNLTRASHVFHLDPWWNPAVEHQATDRAHRIGQTGTVFVHRLLMQHTIEESMMVLKQRKQGVYDRIMAHAAGLAERGTGGGGDSARSALLTREDFEFLIGGGAGGETGTAGTAG